MKKIILAAAVLFVGMVLLTGPSFAHSGGLNKEGCHNNHKTGDYHCHGEGNSAAPTKAKKPSTKRSPATTTRSKSSETKKSGKKASKRKSKTARGKATRVSSTIRGLKKKGTVVVFKDKGKVANARIGSKTKIYIGGKKVKRKALKRGLNCTIVYAGEMSQAKTIRCKSAGKKKAKAIKRKSKKDVGKK